MNGCVQKLEPNVHGSIFHLRETAMFNEHTTSDTRNHAFMICGRKLASIRRSTEHEACVNIELMPSGQRQCAERQEEEEAIA